MGNNSVSKFIFRLSRFLVYRGSVLGRFYCILAAMFGFCPYVARPQSSLGNAVCQV